MISGGIYYRPSREIKEINLFYFELLLFDREHGNLEAAVVAQGHKSVTVTNGCGFDPHSRKRNIYLYLYFFALVLRKRAVLSSATQHAMPPKIGGKWGTECLNNRFPLPTLLCAGCSVKLICFLIGT